MVSIIFICLTLANNVIFLLRFPPPRPCITGDPATRAAVPRHPCPCPLVCYCEQGSRRPFRCSAGAPYRRCLGAAKQALPWPHTWVTTAARRCAGVLSRPLPTSAVLPQHPRATTFTSRRTRWTRG